MVRTEKKWDNQRSKEHLQVGSSATLILVEITHIKQTGNEVRAEKAVNSDCLKRSRFVCRDRNPNMPELFKVNHFKYKVSRTLTLTHMQYF